MEFQGFWDLELRRLGLFKVRGLGFMAKDFKVWGLGFRISKFKVWGVVGVVAEEVRGWGCMV